MPCPKGVNIPVNFDLYNRVTFYQDDIMHNRFVYALKNNGFENVPTSYASKCVECGLCVKKCPQSIDIPNQLKKVDRKFEGFMLRVSEIFGKIMYRRAK